MRVRARLTLFWAWLALIILQKCAHGAFADACHRHSVQQLRRIPIIEATQTVVRIRVQACLARVVASWEQLRLTVWHRELEAALTIVFPQVAIRCVRDPGPGVGCGTFQFCVFTLVAGVKVPIHDKGVLVVGSRDSRRIDITTVVNARCPVAGGPQILDNA